MTKDELTAALDAAARNDEVWALVVRHRGGALECQHWTGDAYALASTAALEDFVREALLSPDPVNCAVAALAGLHVLNYCDRCETIEPQIRPPYRQSPFA